MISAFSHRSKREGISACAKNVWRASILTLILCCVIFSAAFCADTPSSYRLGPEDVVVVTVARHHEFSGEFLIPADGTLNLPSVRAVKAGGMTLQELAGVVTTKLKDRLLEPEVTVILKTPRMQRIYVLGQVKAPGLYDMKPGWRITEAVAAAGGLTPETDPAECKAIILKSATGERQTQNLGSAIRGAAEANLPLESGDVLTIDSGETIPIYVMGRVKNPSLYKVRKEEAGVMEALTLAGGTLEDAALTAVRVTHLSGASETVDISTAIVGGKKTSKITLQPGDLVLVPLSSARVAVLGYVGRPGFYNLREGQKVTLSDALGMAEGVDNKRGGMGAIAVIRTENGEQQKLIFDLTKFVRRGDVSQNPEIKPGDVVYVPQSRKPDWDNVFRAISSVGILLNPFIP